MGLMRRVLHPYKGRSVYWSCSSFAKKLIDKSNIPNKPEAATLEEWKEWENTAKSINPKLYWITEVALDNIQDVIYHPVDVYREIKAYVKNRFVYKTHITETGIEKGEWGDFCSSLGYTIFNRLEKFIIQEKGKGSLGKGLEYLDWEMTLTEESPNQALSALIQNEALLWWLNNKHRDLWEEAEKNKSEKDGHYKLYCKLQREFYDEETRHLLALISVRDSLWT